MHPGRVLDDPVKQVSQGEDVAPGMSIGTDGCCTHTGQSGAE